MLAGEPEWMTSRSVAQIATASMRTSTSARPGTGIGLSRRNSSSGPPKTQAFIWSGTGKLDDVVTPGGLYIGRFLVFSEPSPDRWRLQPPAQSQNSLHL